MLLGASIGVWVVMVAGPATHGAVGAAQPAATPTADAGVGAGADAGGRPGASPPGPARLTNDTNGTSAAWSQPVAASTTAAAGGQAPAAKAAGSGVAQPQGEVVPVSAHETAELLRLGHTGRALLNALAQNCGAVLGVFGGIALGRLLAD